MILKVTEPINNMPDFASSLESLQLRSRNFNKRSGCFGASLNMLTDSYSKKVMERSLILLGVLIPENIPKFSTGLIDDHFELAGRVSAFKIGRIHRQSSF
jgi:iron complex outermembrane receptor protein